MIHPVSRLLAVCAAALFLGACAAAHRVEFKEDDFRAYLDSGSGTINGKAFRVRSDSSTVTETSGTIVRLIPATAYTDEIARRRYANHERLARPDPRLARYVRKTQTDDHGHFEFTHVPPGAYYVSCRVQWTDPTEGLDADGHPIEAEVHDDQWLSDRTWVKNREVTTVTGWAQGR
jgi:hypothetical protein